MSLYDVKYVDKSIIKTIDELVESSIADDKALLPDEIIIDDLIIAFTNPILNLLKSKDNPPSKYDLRIIESITRLMSIGGDFAAYHNEQFIAILEVYKNRKV